MDSRRSSRIKRTAKPEVNNCLQTDATINKKIKTNDLLPNDSQLQAINAQISPYFKSKDSISVEFFKNKSCIELSKALLGQILCRRLTIDGKSIVLRGRIVETEAYCGLEDKACMTYAGRRTDRNEPMYMSAGTCFVYMTYGMYFCFNISAEGEGEAVLLRAVQPLEGIDSMQRLRAQSRKGQNRDKSVEYKQHLLANGPSKLCMAFDINKNNINKVDITDSDLIWIDKGETVPSNDIISAKRIGINRAEEWNDKPLRFYVKDCQYVSYK